MGEVAAPPQARHWQVVALAGLVMLVDQASKLWAVSALTGREPVPLLGEALRLRLTYNPGAAFSIGTSHTWVFTIAAAVAVVALLAAAHRAGTPGWAVALGCLLGGASSHLLDRLVREPGFARGRVVDFLDYGGMLVGNLADAALTCGAVLMVWLSLRGVPLRGQLGPGAPEPAKP